MQLFVFAEDYQVDQDRHLRYLHRVVDLHRRHLRQQSSEGQQHKG